jgi:hypothetical protein
VTILVEDQSLERFMREVLLNLGFSRHELRFEPLPVGKGSAKDWIDSQYPSLVELLRSKNFQQNLAVVIGTDADELTVDQRSQRLTKSLAKSGLPPRSDEEKIVHIIPKWNIETWLLYFADDQRDEVANYKNDLKKPDFPVAANAFVVEWRAFQKDVLIETQPSLKIAYAEVSRL